VLWLNRETRSGGLRRRWERRSIETLMTAGLRFADVRDPDLADQHLSTARARHPAHRRGQRRLGVRPRRRLRVLAQSG
jgi:hypothetical protein